MSKIDNNNVLLKVENLCQYFSLGPGRELKAVHNVSFDIHKGEVFGLVGESGCGKTTTGRSIIKLYDITSGNIYFKGVRICAGIRSYKDAINNARKEAAKKIAEIRASGAVDADEQIAQVKAQLKDEIAKQRQLIKEAKHDHKNCNKMYASEQMAKVREKYEQLIASATSEEEVKTLKKQMKEEIRIASKDRIVNKIQMIFQDPIASLDPRMTVAEIISEGLIIKGIKDKEYIREQVYKALEQVSLVREHADRYPHEFSGGQRQRIGVARSIIMEPELIIADEPISALDVSIQAQVINLLNELRSELGLTILFIAHDLSVVKYFSDRIGVMYFGNMVELATSDDLFAHPLHPYTRSLLSAIPLPDPIYEKSRKRITYNPLAEHDYSQQAPSFREVSPGHFVMCNDVEFERYQQELKK